MKKKLTGVALVLAAVSLMGIQPAEACTRAVYLGPDGMVVTGRTMDWKEDIMSNIYVFPRGMQRAGHNKEKTVNWTSKYGSVIATGYDIGTCDGMNEKGLVASLLFLPESVYSLPGDTRPAMGISIWTQYVLDNFATVREAVDEMKKETFRIDAPRMPNGGPESTLHMAITDETGNTAVIEYLDGKRKVFDLPLSLKGTDFQKQVWQALRDIPYGETRSYKQIAVAIGNPKAVRAVGMANNRNPLLIVVPCHRVIGTDGKMVGYAAGMDKKEFLLRLEGSLL